MNLKNRLKFDKVTAWVWQLPFSGLQYYDTAMNPPISAYNGTGFKKQQKYGQTY